MQDWLAASAQVHPNKIALMIQDQQWTYAELNRFVNAFSEKLHRHNVSQGQMVAVLMPNSLEYVCLIHALMRLQAVLVPLNTRLTTRELDWQLTHLNCNTVICSSETEIQAGELANRKIISVHATQFSTVPEMKSKQGLSDEMENTLQAIVFTSGTTGNPKGVMLTAANFFWSAMASAFRLGTQPDDRWLCCMPLYHVGGLNIIYRCCLYGTTVVLQNGFDIESVNHTLDNQKITLISLVPTMLYRLLNTRDKFPATLRLILLGGAAASPELIRECQQQNLPVAPTYGLTEVCSQVATMLPQEAYRKAGSVGKPLMFTSIRIVDEVGQILPPNEYGEVVVASPMVMRGYFGQNPLSGEIYTGDIGYLDTEGDLWLVQRRSDLIVSGGENVYPAEVEQILRQHPAIAQVCVVGIEHPEWGQQVAAAVVLKNPATEADILNFSRQHLAGYKQPRRIKFVEALPQTASGKIQRQAVREHFAD